MRKKLRRPIDSQFCNWAFKQASRGMLIRASQSVEGSLSTGLHVNAVIWYHDGEWPLAGFVDFGSGFAVRTPWLTAQCWESGYESNALLVAAVVNDWPDSWKIERRVLVERQNRGTTQHLSIHGRTAVQVYEALRGSLLALLMRSQTVNDRFCYGEMLKQVEELIIKSNRELDRMVA